VRAVVRPVGDEERLSEILQVGIAGVADLSFPEHDPERPSTLRGVDRADATTLATHAELRLLGHLDLGDHPAGRGSQPREVDAGRLADQTASAVAADEILRSERWGAGQLDVDAVAVLREARHLTVAKDRNPQPFDPARQDRLEVALRERKPVVVTSREVADVHDDLGDLPRREEPLGDAALIEHLDGAGEQAPGP
jgi:hypothetical protein